MEGDSNIIDLTAERDRRNGPDPEHVRHDEFGRPLYHFAVDYDMAGGRWSFGIWAYDWADADAKVAAIRQSATVAGQVYCFVPA